MEVEASTAGIGTTIEARISKDSHILATASPERGFRACIECRRKKTRCDMRQPICGLCRRTGGSCTFPTKRKAPEFRKRPAKEKEANVIDPQRLEHLVSLLESRLDETPKSQSSTGESPGRDQGSVQSSATSPSYSGSIGTCREDAEQHVVVVSSSNSANLLGHYLQPDSRQNVEFETASSNGSTEKTASWTEIPEELVTELVNLYFDKIQAWLPLLHRPNFFTKYVVDCTFQMDRLLVVSLEEGLLLHGMFALAARHSNHEYLKGLPSPNRGQSFAERAIEYYAKLRSSDGETTLEYLQGCILLAFYLYTSGPSHQAWILTGVCVRLAYDLDLCCVDEEDDDMEMAAAEWSADEERRRAFWLVWEIDTFASILSMRPRGLNSQRIVVRLPVSDEAWFSNRPCESPVVPLDPTQAWKVLLDSPNKEERAWFLLANYIMALAYETASGRQKSQRDHSELTSSMTYFCLAVSQRHGLETNPPAFAAGSFAKANWIIGMHLMLTNTRACLSALAATPFSNVETFEDDYSRIFNRWHPEYIALSHPFFAGTLLSARTYPSLSSSRPMSISCNQELSALILSHFATFWKLGSVLLGKYIPFHTEPIHQV
ncbi:fungal-specific transcription factor domain-containing protein [Colletotrichum godetiae]|uniref:Fungal-specific transcription factor domain-containing protein n=1 Tax=Colletotrichum godetiae TaxID=1209918 RepID=A0AAJ0AHM3_9PEZI|nr:fungal-specific transcription factor domain-containing protein [Colletotrichum godetiae]KAK1674052.1 fungal-specific transcription factor domain-containing protein [Colletotrichum godetiae]